MSLNPPIFEYADVIQQWQDRVLHWMDKPDEASFSTLACELHAFQKARCPVIAAYSAVVSREDEPCDWKQIPALPLEAFKRTRVTIFPEEATVREFRTSGTTGERYGQHFFADLTLYEKSTVAGWEASGLPVRGAQWLLMPDETQAPYSSLGAMFGFLGRLPEVKQQCFWRGDRLEVEPLLQAAGEVRDPVCVAGTALAWLHLLEHCEARGVSFRLPTGSVLFETGGYKGTGRAIGKSELYGRLEALTGVAAGQIWNEYGMTELSSQFYTRGLGKVHRGAPWVRAVVIDPASGLEADEGERGILRIVDLANIGSCVAVETGDLAIRRGSAFELIGRDPSALPRGCSRVADAALAE